MRPRHLIAVVLLLPLAGCGDTATGEPQATETPPPSHDVAIVIPTE